MNGGAKACSVTNMLEKKMQASFYCRSNIGVCSQEPRKGEDLTPPLLCLLEPFPKRGCPPTSPDSAEGRTWFEV